VVVLLVAPAKHLHRSLLLLLLLAVLVMYRQQTSAAVAAAPAAFWNPGTPPNVSMSYDCAWRQHAWAFAKATLPHRGNFRSVFDALQLQACGLQPPPVPDTFVAPRFPTPSNSATTAVLYAAVNATKAGDGSRERPFTLVAAVAAVTAAPRTHTVTLLLRGGTYRLAETLRLGPQHSNLTIQNFEGEEVIVSGAAAVAVTRAAWSLVNASTNTWRLDIRGQEGKLFPQYGLRVGAKRAILAKCDHCIGDRMICLL
jgi:hypothetical protein